MKLITKLFCLALVLVMSLSLAPTALAEGGHTHSWRERSRTEPTCTKEGSVIYVCSCGETKTETLPALGHAWNAGEILEDEGFPGGKKLHFWCWRCGATRDEALPAEEPDDYGWEPPEEPEEPASPDGAVSPAGGEAEEDVLVLVDSLMEIDGLLGEKVDIQLRLINTGDEKLYDPVVDLYRWDKSVGDFSFFSTVYSSDECLQAKGGDCIITNYSLYFISDWDLENTEDSLTQIAFKARARTEDGIEVNAKPLVLTYPVFDASVHLEVEDASAGQIPEDGWVKVKLKASCEGTETLIFITTNLWVYDPDGKAIFYTEGCELHNYDMSWFVPGSTEDAELWIKVNDWDLKFNGVHRAISLYFKRLIREDRKTVFPYTPMGEVVGTDWIPFVTNEVYVDIPLLAPPTDPAPAPEPQPFCEPALTGLGEGTAEWTLTRCDAHAALAREAEGKTPEEALALWQEALDAEYAEWLAEAEESLRPLIQAERDAFHEQLEAYRAAWADLVGEDYAAEKAAELIKHKLGLLCFARHADEAAWSAVFEGAESLESLPQAAASCRAWSQDLGAELRCVEENCENHRGLGLQATDAESARALKLSWLLTLNGETDAWYLGMDEENRPRIAEARQSFGRWLAAEGALLKLQYPENEALVQQLLALALRDRAMDSCCAGGVFSPAIKPGT